MRNITLRLGLAACLAPLVALAAPPYVDIEQRLTPEQVREVGLTPAQLALLNRMLREASEKDMPAAAEPAEPAEHGAARSYIGLEDAPIRSRLVGSISAWEPGTVFVLENGQQWKVLKGRMTLGKPLQAPEVIVVPGLAGRWFLQVGEDIPKPRVYRID